MKTRVIYSRKYSKIIAIMLLCLQCVLVYSSCSKKPEYPIITVKGSDSMVILMQRWAERFPDKSIRFQVTGGGTGTGLSALINGTTDICAASRPLRYDEVLLLRKKNNYAGMEVRVARDGLAVYVHKNNPVKKLTIRQVKKIFSGEITNWKEVGGADERIVVYSRENNSGTYIFFKENILKEVNFAPETQYLVGTGALVRAVGLDVNGIGYGGVAYTGNVDDVALAEHEGAEYVYPSSENILTGKYPTGVSRLLYLYLAERPKPHIKKFIDWVLSPEGQKVVQEIGYFSVQPKLGTL